MNLVMLPMWIFWGSSSRRSRFPDAVQPLIRALPLTAVIDALRATMLRGAGLPEIWPELAIITAGGWSPSFILAVWLFRWRSAPPRR